MALKKADPGVCVGGWVVVWEGGWVCGSRPLKKQGVSGVFVGCQDAVCMGGRVVVWMRVRV